jgi:outer membrane protein OmpA-like peptidoglycan-associated protein/tetratricopeptide (TPR) repeat protein
MKINKLFILAFALGSQYSYAQPTSGKLTDEKVEQVADERSEMNDTYNALTWYETLHARNPDDLDAIFNVAMTHDKLRDYPKSEEWFKKLVEKDVDKKYPLARYLHGKALRLSGNYNEAITELEEFKKVYGSDQPKYDYYQEMAQIKIDGARWAIQNMDANEETLVENMGKNVNSTSTEGSVYPIGREKLIYTALRTDTLIYMEDEDEPTKYAKIYFSDANGEDWTEAAEYNKDQTQKDGFHAAQPTFNTDLSKFYFVRATLDGNSLENSRIYVADHNDGVLGEPKLLEINSAQFSNRNPSVAKWGDKEYLLFTSNMEGGKGGFDIWYAEINEDGSTKAAVNLEAVNTIGDDITPFFDERQNMFYFSTDGLPGMGGYDIFRSERTPSSGAMSTPENMGAGFNTRVDDFGFVMNKQGIDDCYGYIISNRPGTMSMKGETCCDDIFSIIMSDRCDIILTTKIYKDPTGEDLDGATVQLIDKETGEVVDEQTNTEGNEFTFMLDMGKKYEIRSSKDGLENGSTEVDVTKDKLKADGFDITKPIEIEDKVAMKELGLMVRTFDKKSNATLEGVTVTVFDAETGEEITKQTIDASNEFAFAVPRTKSYKVFAKKPGYIADSRIIAKEDLGLLQKMYLTPPPVFYNVYFDFNKSNIRQGANDTLDMVANTLKDNPDMKVEVRGHTDAKGSDQYNDRLSMRRTEQTIAYLKNKGIDVSRLESKGLGEQQPAADNTKPDGSDNPEGRQLNRRVEFKIIAMPSLGMTEVAPEKKN